MRIVNVISLAFFLPALAFAQPPIEILAGGTHYDSMELYKASKIQKPKVITIGSTEPAEEEQLRAQTKALGMDFDPKKVKTITLEPSLQTQKKLESVGIEPALGHVIADFNQNWDNPVPKFAIDPKDLESRLLAVAGDRKGTVMIIADAGKLRVMDLEPSK